MWAAVRDRALDSAAVCVASAFPHGPSLSAARTMRQTGSQAPPTDPALGARKPRAHPCSEAGRWGLRICCSKDRLFLTAALICPPGGRTSASWRRGDSPSVQTPLHLPAPPSVLPHALVPIPRRPEDPRRSVRLRRQIWHTLYERRNDSETPQEVAVVGPDTTRLRHRRDRGGRCL